MRMPARKEMWAFSEGARLLSADGYEPNPVGPKGPLPWSSPRSMVRPCRLVMGLMRFRNSYE